MRFTGFVATVLACGVCTAAFAQSRPSAIIPPSQFQPIPQVKPDVPVVNPATVPSYDSMAPAAGGNGWQEQGTATTVTTKTTPGGPIDSVGEGAIPMLPIDVQNVNGVNYLTGGIGDEELEVLKSKSSQFNVHVLMSAPTGEYVSEVAVRITDSKGAEVMSAANTGPYFYVQLPPGSYTLTATSAKGETKSVKIKAGAKASGKQHIVFVQ